MTLLAIALAALLAYTKLLRDDVVLARVLATSGDVEVVPTLDGRRVQRVAATESATGSGDAPSGTPSPDPGHGATAPGPGDGTTPDDAGGDGDPGAGDTDPDGGDGPGGADSESGSGSGSEPGSGDGSAPEQPGTGELQVDGFSIASADNMQPGDVRSGTITLRNTGTGPVDVFAHVTGTDANECFSYAALTTQRASSSDTWSRLAAIGDGATSPATPTSTPLGTWQPGHEMRIGVDLAMRPSCTVGSGLSSNGSTSLADRHPGHAQARLQFTFSTRSTP